jgi:hypothetical protein
MPLLTAARENGGDSISNSFEDALIDIWREVCVENAKVVNLGGECNAKAETS